MRKKYYGCIEIARLIKYKGSCCGSCHEDCDAGYDELTERELSRGRVAYLCCAVARAFDDWLEKKSQTIHDGQKEEGNV